MPDALTTLSRAADRIGVEATTYDAEERQAQLGPLAAERAQAVATIAAWRQAAVTMVPTLQQWQRVFDNPHFDRLDDKKSREGRARRLVVQRREGLRNALERFASVPRFIQGRIDRLDEAAGRYDSVPSWIDDRRRELASAIGNRPYGAELLAELEAEALDIDRLTGGRIRVARATREVVTEEAVVAPSHPLICATSSTVEAG
jgi:hypothetical protein